MSGLLHPPTRACDDCKRGRLCMLQPICAEWNTITLAGYKAGVDDSFRATVFARLTAVGVSVPDVLAAAERVAVQTFDRPGQEDAHEVADAMLCLLGVSTKGPAS